MQVAFALEPTALVFCELTGVDLDLLDGFIEREPAGEVGEELGVADGLAGLVTYAAGIVMQTTGFVDEPGRQHFPYAQVDAAVVVLALAGEADGDPMPVVAARSGALPLTLQRADGLAGQVIDLERAFDAAEVVGVDAAGGVGVFVL